jgi:hypothetical protein
MKISRQASETRQAFAKDLFTKDPSRSVPSVNDELFKVYGQRMSPKTLYAIRRALSSTGTPAQDPNQNVSGTS